MRVLNLYVASSWRNQYQPDIVELLKAVGHDVYDFRNPPGGSGFSWSSVNENWQDWTVAEYKQALLSEEAQKGFVADFDAMKRADACVLVLPCGRSAHIEAGWCSGFGKPVFCLIPEHQEAELMYRVFRSISATPIELITQIQKFAFSKGVELDMHTYRDS